MLSAFILILIIGYGYWAFGNTSNNRTYLLPLRILACCLLLVLVIDFTVFQWAQVVSYSPGTGLKGSEINVEPNYAGEKVPVVLSILTPLLGLLWANKQLMEQGVKKPNGHLLFLMLLAYTISLFILFAIVESKPQLFRLGPLPAIGSRIKT